MALTIVDEPVDIVLARNPVVLHLKAAQSGGDLYTAVGVSASMEVETTDRFDTGETLTVEYTEPDGTVTTLVFTAASAYSGVAEIPDDTWSGGGPEYWTEVAAILNSHPRIAPFFTVEPWTVLGQLTIRILARSTEAGWEVDISNTGGFTVTQDTDGTADSTPDNYRVLVEVFFEQSYRSGDYTRVAQLTGQPNPANGYLYFDLSSVLASHCRASRTEPMVPNWGTTGAFVADNLRRYYVRYTEQYGTPAVVQEWAHLDVKFVMDGGVSQAVHKQSGYFGYLSTLDETDAFLTWTPNGKRVGLYTPEYLTWYNYTDADQDVILEVVMYDVDTGAAKSSLFFVSFSDSVRAKECAVFPADLSRLIGDVNIGANTDAYKYTLRVVDNTSDWEGGSPEYFSEARTYYIDRNYYESTRYVQYLNGFGLPETIRCTGEWGKRIEVQRSTAERPLPPGYTPVASDNFQYARAFNPLLTYRTGFLRKGDAETLQEMLIAGEIYDVSADGYIPLQITDNRFDVTSTYEDLHAYQFACRPRLNMKNFSSKKLSQSDADAWEEPSGDFWFDALQVAWAMP